MSELQNYINSQEPNLKDQLDQANTTIDELQKWNDFYAKPRLKMLEDLEVEHITTIDKLCDALEDAAEVLEKWRIAEGYSVVAKYRAIVKEVRGNEV